MVSKWSDDLGGGTEQSVKVFLSLLRLNSVLHHVVFVLEVIKKINGLRYICLYFFI